MSFILDRAPMLFALGSSHGFGERVAAQLGIALDPVEEREFEDGEHKTRPLASVRGSDVFVLHSLFGEARQSANDKLCRLLFFIGALRDAGAARVTALVPYLAYARKDRKTRPRDPVTTRYVAMLFEAVGTDALVTVDVHNLAAFQNAFRCGAENLNAAALFVEHFAPLLAQRDVAVVAPDAGAVKRAENFRLRLERALCRPVGMAIAEKHRSAGVVSGELLVGDVCGRDVLIVDDLVSSGATLARAAGACRDRGAHQVFAAATHGLFTAGAPALLAGAGLDRLAVSDTAWPFAGTQGLAPEPLEVLSCTGLFAQAIRCIHEGGSITELLET